jgi:phage-related minor tail protein
MALDAVAELARRKKAGTHVERVERETRVELPEAAIDALKAMAAKMQEMDARNRELEQRLAQVEAPLRALAEEAKRRMDAA